LIVDEISYRFETPRRGEVIIFRYPLEPSQFFIKRVVGLPGENVEVKDGKVYINGSELNETKYLQNIETVGNVEVKLDKDEYFVLGDNRDASSDSRKWGEVDKKLIIGRAWLRAWPVNRLGAVNK